MTISLTRTLAATAAVLALAGTAACGTVGTSRDGAAHLASSAPSSGAGQPAVDAAPAALLLQASNKTGAARSAKITETIQQGAGTITGQGTMSWADGFQGTMRMQLPQATGAKLGGDGAMDAQFTPDAMYINMHLSSGPMAAQLGGKHWIKYAFADLAQYMGPAGSSLKDGFKGADPVEAVRKLIASGRVTKVGTDTVNGAPATHYSGDVTVDQLASGNKWLPFDQTEALRKQLSAAGITKDHVEVWVDASDLLVKKSEQADTKNGTLDVTVTYSDYGVQVKTDPPAASDTVDFAQLMAAAKQPAKS